MVGSPFTEDHDLQYLLRVEGWKLFTLAQLPLALALLFSFSKFLPPLETTGLLILQAFLTAVLVSSAISSLLRPGR
jgi:hypothetical protein